MKNLINDLETLFNEVSPKIHCKSNSISTKELKTAFTKLAKNYGYTSAPNNEEDEYLYDIIWYKNHNNDMASLADVPLIVESEWSKYFDDIKYDFEKLLISKSEYKIMIFQTDGKLEDVTEKLISIINNYSNVSPHEKYILAGFVNSTGKIKMLVYSKTE